MTETPAGFLLIDKPKKITSFDVIYKLRKITGIKKIGHAGTLDPLATGLLLCAIGRPATRQIDQFIKLDKTYQAKIKLGEISDTYDKEGQVTKIECNKIPQKEIAKILKKFQGQIKQVPPMFSAKKIKGQKLYDLARQGKTVKRPAQNIIIYNLKIIKYKFPYLDIEIKCSSGTYIRSLAHDFGQTLGCGALLADLKRTQIGQYSLKQAVKLSQLNKKNWQKYLLPINQRKGGDVLEK